MRKKDELKDLIEFGADITGSISASIVGGLLIGPMGLAIGGASGPVITRILKQVGSEVRNRLISKREYIRIGAAFTFAIQRLNEIRSKGEDLREDNFFELKSYGRSSAEEIFEAIVLMSQKEYEERKVKYFGFLFANVCTRSDISAEYANHLIKVSTDLSFRQFCLLRLFNEVQFSKIKEPHFVLTSTDLILEIRDLQQKRILNIGETYNPTFKESSLDLKAVWMTKHGMHLLDLLSLNEMPDDDIAELKVSIGLNNL